MDDLIDKGKGFAEFIVEGFRGELKRCPEGALPVPDGAETTQMGYEFYPESLANVLRHVAQCTDIPLLVTENGIATDDDAKRIEFIRRVLDGIHKCRAEGISVIGYLHWSLLDNYEWGSYKPTFGLVEVDKQTFERRPRPSLNWLGGIARTNVVMHP